MNIYFKAKYDLQIEFGQEKLNLKADQMAQVNASSEDKFLVVCKNICYYVSAKDGIKLLDDSVLIYLNKCFELDLNKVKRKIIKKDEDFIFIEWTENSFTLQSSYINYVLKCGITDVQVETKHIVNKKVIFIKIYSNNAMRCLILDDNLIFEGKVKEINIDNDNIVILKDDNVLYGQNRVVVYNVKDEKKESFLVYLDDREVCFDIDIRCLFLDAVMIESNTFVNKCLDKNLNISLENIKEFLGDFDNYYFIEENVILEKNNEITKVVNLVVNNDKICDILD